LRAFKQGKGRGAFKGVDVAVLQGKNDKVRRRAGKEVGF